MALSLDRVQKSTTKKKNTNSKTGSGKTSPMRETKKVTAQSASQKIVKNPTDKANKKKEVINPTTEGTVRNLKPWKFKVDENMFPFEDEAFSEKIQFVERDQNFRGETYINRIQQSSYTVSKLTKSFVWFRSIELFPRLKVPVPSYFHIVEFKNEESR